MNTYHVCTLLCANIVVNVETKALFEETEQEAEGENFEEYIFRRTKEFNEKTRHNPKDIELWLSFVKFQDESFKMQRRKNPTAITEKKLAILDKALYYNPNNAALLSAHLRECRNIVQYVQQICLVNAIRPDKLEQAWKSALQRVPDSVQLWNEYLLFKKSVFSEFNVTSMRDKYVLGLKTFMAVKRRTSVHGMHTIFLQLTF